MKQSCIFIVLLFTLNLSHAQDRAEGMRAFVQTNFENLSRSIDAIEYRVTGIDTFPKGGVQRFDGYALLERNSNDPKTGFSFYCKEDRASRAYLYANGYDFEIFNRERRYLLRKNEDANFSPIFPKLIYNGFLFPDSSYESVNMWEEEGKYALQYAFQDDPTNGLSQVKKTIFLDKTSYFPSKIIWSSLQGGEKLVRQLVFEEIQVNRMVEQSIDGFREDMHVFKMENASAGRSSHPLLYNQYPTISLPSLYEPDDIHDLEINELTLLGFWEVWCKPCVQILPEVEKLRRKYKRQLNVVGIVSSDLDEARQTLSEAGTTYLTLIGNQELQQTYRVVSLPNFVLIDEQGRVRKEYSTFDYRTIANDLDKLLGK